MVKLIICLSYRSTVINNFEDMGKDTLYPSDNQHDSSF